MYKRGFSFGAAKPAGVSGELQINSNGKFGAASNTYWNEATQALYMGTATLTANDPVLYLETEWNNAAENFTGLFLDVTNTASSATSLLADFQIGGVQRFGIRADPYGSNTMVVVIGGNGGAGGGIGVSYRSFFLAGDTIPAHAPAISWGYWGYSVNGDYGMKFSPSAGMVGFSANDPTLYREGNGHLIQRNGVNAQQFSVANIYNSSTDYEIGGFKWNANVLEIGTYAAGTGTARNISLVPAGGQALFPNGTSTAPGMAFASSTNIGLSVSGTILSIFAGTNGETRVGNSLKYTRFINTGGGGIITNDATVNGTLDVAGVTTFTNATVKMTNLPTSDPGVSGALWNDAGTLKISP